MAAVGLSALIALSSAPAPAQAPLLPAPAQAPLLNETLELSGTVLFLESKAPGLVIGAVRNGETAVLGFGKASEGSDRPPDGDSLIHVGSITKVFTGAALASLVADGKVHFTDSLQDRLGWNVAAPNFEGADIRLIDLATHASGLPRDYDTSGSAGGSARPADQEALGVALQASKLLFAPGTGALYSNFGFDLLAQAIASAAGKPYADVLKERVLDPAGLKDTMFSLPEGAAARVMQGHDPDGKPIPDTVSSPMNQGSGSLYSTPNDILKWLSWHMDRLAKADAEMRLLDHAAYLQRDGLNPVFGLDEAAPMDAMGLGWVIMAPEGSRPLIMNKSGGFEGTFTYIAFAPTRGVGVFVSMNQFNFGAFRDMAKMANDLIEQLAPR
jgi:D-alanyl-D-alanine-carboxypeptidase/D-alanyl-D-alanine-endopeptidase